MKFFVVLLAFMASSAFSLDFNLRVMNGEGGYYNTKDHYKKVHVYEAFFLGCPYCNQNTGNVDELAKNYIYDETVEVFDVGRDCRDAQYQQWVRAHNPSHKVLNDCGGKQILGRLGIRSYPTVVIHNCEGVEVFRATGVWSISTKTKIKRAIERSLMTCG